MVLVSPNGAQLAQSEHLAGALTLGLAHPVAACGGTCRLCCSWPNCAGIHFGLAIVHLSFTARHAVGKLWEEGEVKPIIADVLPLDKAA